jgi:glutathione S-transferase|eukprot:COSAG01_NODE_8334_length_2824_cov_10.786055_1_plen_157_part_00
MASTTTTSITHPDGTIVNITTTSAAPAATADGSVKIYGMAISGNVIPCVLQALDTGVGNLSNIDFMAGEHKTEKMLAVNPFHQMPSMQDGDFCLAESNAIQRYMAAKYAPELYGAGNVEQQATIDWALDWCSTNLYKQYSEGPPHPTSPTLLPLRP